MTAWSRWHMTCWLGSSPHSSHHPAKFVDLVPCESEDKIFLTCHVNTQLKCHVTLWVDSHNSKSPPCQILGSCTIWKWKYNVFYLSSDHVAEVSRDIVGGVPFILRHHPAKFGLHRPCESADTTFFWFVTWPRDWCATWLCRWVPLIVSYQPAEFGVHGPCDSGNITFFICQVTKILNCNVTLWLGSPHPKSPIG